MPATVNIDGRIVSEQQASISVFDHGFLYGEGVYEVLRTYRKEPFLYEPHMTRLRQSAEQITLTVPWTDAEMHARIAATIAAVRHPRRRLRPHPAHPRRRRTRLRPGRLPEPDHGDHRQAARRSAGARLRGRRDDLARADRPEPPGEPQSAHQVEQPAEQRAGDAAGRQASGASKR